MIYELVPFFVLILVEIAVVVLMTPKASRDEVEELREIVYNLYADQCRTDARVGNLEVAVQKRDVVAQLEARLAEMEADE